MKKMMIGLFCIGLLIILTANVSAADSVTGTQQNETANLLSQQQAQFLQYVEGWARTLFAISSGETLDMSYLIILIVIFIVVALIVINLASFIAIFSGWRATAAGVIITLLISISGGIRIGALWLLSFKNLFSATSIFGKIWLLVLLIIIAIVLSAFLHLVNKIRRELGLEKSKALGRDLILRLYGASKKRKLSVGN